MYRYTIIYNNMYTFCTARINYYTRRLYYKKQNCHKSCRRVFNIFFFFIDLFRTKNPTMVVFIIEHWEELRFFIYAHYIMYSLSTYIVRTSSFRWHARPGNRFYCYYYCTRYNIDIVYFARRQCHTSKKNTSTSI